MAETILERTNGLLSVTGWRDHLENRVNLTQLDIARASIAVATDPTAFILRSVDLLELPDVTLDANGNLTWELGPALTRIIGEIDFRGTEQHVAYIRVAWGTADFRDLTNCLSATVDTQLLRVACPAHGLAINDTVFVVTDTDVGGLDVASAWPVIAIPDADHFTLEHTSTFTATATNAGGNVRLALKCRSQAVDVIHSIRRNEPL